MKANQVSTHELFSNNSSERHEFNEVRENFSQLQNSQYDFTQCSQDMMYNSQQFSSGSDISQYQQQGKRFFDRYMAGSVGSQSRKESKSDNAKGNANNHQNVLQTQRCSSRPNFQQQWQLNKAKAKDRDEKDYLSSIVRTVEQCSDEMNHTMKEIQKIINKNVDTSDAKLSKTINSVSENINENYRMILAAIQERDDRKTRLEVLEKEIAVRDSTIIDLKQQIVEAKNGMSKEIITTMKEIVDHQQNTTEEKLKQILEITSEQLSSQQEIMSMQHEEKEQKHMFKIHVENSCKKESEKLQTRVLQELLQLKDELYNHKCEMENFYKEQLTSFHGKHTKDIQNSIQTGLERNAQMSKEQTNESLCLQEKQIQEISQKHQSRMETFIKKQFHEHQDQQLQFMNSIQENISERKGFDSRAFEYHESIPKKIQNQLDSMHRHHLEEIDRIRKEFTSEKENKQEKNLKPQINFAPVHEQAETEISNKSDCVSSIPFSSKPSFISPGIRPLRTLNSKILFSKTYPSPVATVHPQPKEQQEAWPVTSNKLQIYASGERPIIRRPQRLEEDQNIYQTETERRRGEIDLFPQKYQPARLKTDRDDENHRESSSSFDTGNLNFERRRIISAQNKVFSENDSERCSTQLPGNRKKEMLTNIFRNRSLSNPRNFNESCNSTTTENRLQADNLNHKALAREGSLGAGKRNERKLVVSQHDDYSSSTDSSPSMSVTEILIQKRVKRQRNKKISNNSTLDNASNLMDQNQNSKTSSDDFLTSLGMGLDETLKQSLKNGVGNKRKMLDFDTEVTRITRSVCRQKKPKT